MLIFYMSLANSQVFAAPKVAIPVSNTFALDVLIRVGVKRWSRTSR